MLQPSDRLFHTQDKIAGRHAQAFCDAQDQAKRRLSLAAFEFAVVGPIDVGLDRELVLGNALFQALGPNHFAESSSNDRLKRC